MEHCRKENVGRQRGLKKRDTWSENEENFLSSWLREDVKGKERGGTRKPKKRKVEVGRERWMCVVKFSSRSCGGEW